MKDLYIKTKHGDMYYEKHGVNKKGIIILLHGWGQNVSTFKGIISKYKNDYLIYCLDFLGFGLSDEPNTSINVSDYKNHLKTLIEKEKIVDPIIISHSFGGRVAIKYASENKNLKKLILVNPAAIKHRNLRYYKKVLVYKVKKIFIYIFSPSKMNDFFRKNSARDYKNLSSEMKGTFKKIVSEDLKKDLKKIDTKTLIIGSIFDSEIKLEDFKKINMLIKMSTLKMFFRSGHFTYLDEENNFYKVVDDFLNDY